MRPRRVLVTGGAGFIGSHVVDQLVSEGIEVRVLDSLPPGAHGREPDYLNGGAEYVVGDLRDGEMVERALEGVDAVSHQASMVGLGTDLEDAPDYVANNDLGTAVLLRAMHRVGSVDRLVLASSMVVYGEGAYRCVRHGSVHAPPRDPRRLAAGAFEPTCPGCDRSLVPEPVSEVAAVDPRNVYAATKLHQEHLGAVFAREHGAGFVALRYHNVYGPRMPRLTPYAGVASIFLSALAEGHAPRVLEDGRQRRDFIHVRDVARANVLALTVEAVPNGPLNVATGRPRTVGEMAAALTSAFGPGAPVPEVTGGFRLGDVRHVFASTDRAEQRLGFRAGVPFEVGMAELARAPMRAAPTPLIATGAMRAPTGRRPDAPRRG